MSQVEHHLGRSARRSASRTYITRSGLVFLGVVIDIMAITLAAIVVGAAYHSVVYGGFGDINRYLQVAFLTSVFFILPLFFKDKYEVAAYSSFENLLAAAIGAWVFAVLGLLAVGFVGKVSGVYSRGTVLLFAFVGGLAVVFVRAALTWFVRSGTKTHLIAPRRIALVGLKSEISAFQKRTQPWHNGLKVAEAVAIDDLDADDVELSEELDRISQKLRRQNVDDIFLCVPAENGALLDKCFEAFITAPVAIHLGTSSLLDRFDKLAVQKVGVSRVVSLSPVPLSPYDVVLKRIFDLVGGLLAFIILLPVFVVVPALIWFTTGQAPLFKQRRYGFNHRAFTIYKFRTLTADEDGEDVKQVTRGDARITPVGRFLRRWNIDEIPQLLNVLKGEMSLVGPRPHAMVHDVEFSRRVRRYARRHNMKPGITGLAQVSGFRGPTDNEEMLQRRVQADLHYIDNWSLLLDVIILVRTVFDPRAHKNAL